MKPRVDIAICPPSVLGAGSGPLGGKHQPMQESELELLGCRRGFSTW